MNELFRSKGIKSTKQREEIYKIVSEKPSTIKELLNYKSDNIDVSTLYRILDLFIEKEIFLKYVNRDGQIFYMINEGHVHYINCIKCNNRVKINYCPIDEITKNIYNEVGYTLISHNMILDGICGNCQRK